MRYGDRIGKLRLRKAATRSDTADPLAIVKAIFVRSDTADPLGTDGDGGAATRVRCPHESPRGPSLDNPLSWAQKKGHADIEQRLREQGATS